MDFLADYAEVVDADMNFCDSIRIVGENDNQVIEIQVTIKNKEVNEDA
jgi:hypothetical protein